MSRVRVNFSPRALFTRRTYACAANKQAVFGLALGFCELLGQNINGSENINFTSNHLAPTFG